MDFLDEDEHAELFGWGNRAVLSDPTSVSSSIPILFAAQVARAPEAPAVTFNGYSLSYAELDESSDRLAHRLISLGVRPGMRVALLFPRCVEAIVSIVAVLKAGAAYLPIDPMHPDARVRFMLDDAAPVVAVTTAELMGRFAGCDLDVIDFDEVRQHDGQGQRLPAVTADDVAYFIYTSGTTGRPKGVAITHANVVRLLATLDAELGLAGQVWTQCHSLALAGLPERLELPTDRPYPVEADHRGASMPVLLPAELHKRVREVAREHNVTTYMVVQAALSILLSKLSASCDVAVGVPIAGRGDAALDRLVGFFVNTLVLRVDLGGDPTVAELVAQVRQRSLAALEHQDVPFEVLVDRLKPTRSLAHHPLVQVALAWQNFTADTSTEATLGEARVSPLSVDTQVARMDLTFSLAERWDEAGEAAGIGGSVGADDSFFDLGGDSLSAMRLINAINASLDTDLAVRAVFEAPTGAELSARVGESSGRREPLVAQQRPAAIPLSYAQQRLWFLDQLEGPSPIYNMPTAYRITGGLDVDALGAALADVVERHEALRTVFPAVDGVPRQVVLPAGQADLRWQVVDAADWSMDRLHDAIRATVGYNFDLSAEIPLKATLFRLGDDEHVLVAVVHHIAGDGLSIGPETETAAITAPRPSRTGAETLATPGSRSAALCAHPRLRTSASVRSVNLAAGSTACWVAGSA